MTDESSGKQTTSELVARIVSSYVANNAVTPSDLPGLIMSVHRSLAELGQPVEPAAALKPAVSVRQSYGPSFVACLDCGWRGQMLRRHLTTAHDLSPEAYRTKWGLKDTHPLIAPAYASRRSDIAKQLGLGRPRATPEVTVAAVPPAEAPLDPAFIASLSAPKRRGRPRAAPKA